MSRAETLLLPLRSSERGSSWGTLESQVRQIESQKGSFRNVTEQSLKDDIEKAKSGNSEAGLHDEESEKEEEEDIAKTREMKVWKAREEMMMQLARAQNETLTALDFISLLLTKVSNHPGSDVAKSTMSPALQATVPPATINARKVQNQVSASTKQQLESTSIGWKLDSFKKATERILAAGDRLQQQANNEAAFWEQVAELRAAGWTVSRLPRDSRAIGVHFGFLEATPRFRYRGFAILRSSEDGKLRLDSQALSSKPCRVQVSVSQNGNTIGRSKTFAKSATIEKNLSNEIEEARRNLFEEELYFEIGREARTIANQGVTVLGTTVEVEIADDRRLHIELVDYDQSTHSLESTEDDIAEGIVLCLRVLLTKAHQQNLIRRSRPPAPLLAKAPSHPEYALLRPLISQLRHRSALSQLQTSCREWKTTMHTAGLNFTTKFTDNLNFGDSSISSETERLLSILLKAAESVINITLPTSKSLEVKIRTHLGPPNYGTEYSASNLTYEFTTVKASKLSNVSDVTNFLCHSITMDVVAFVNSITSTIPGQDLGEQTDRSYGWKTKGIYNGELELHGPKNEKVFLYIKTWPNRLGLRCARQSTGKTSSWAWHGKTFSSSEATPGEDFEPRHLSDILKELLEPR